MARLCGFSSTLPLIPAARRVQVQYYPEGCGPLYLQRALTMPLTALPSAIWRLRLTSPLVKLRAVTCSAWISAVRLAVLSSRASGPVAGG